MLPLRAEQELKRIETMAAAPAPTPPQSDPNTTHPQPQDPAQLKPALEKAVELGPEIRDLAERAAANLREKNAKEALPKQRQTLKLLEEIIKLLPKNQQKGKNQDQQKNDRNQKNRRRTKKDDSSQQPQKQPRRDPAKKKSEAILKKARDREREYQKKKKLLQGYLRGPVQVEKDW
jgi:hypothetical protein